MTATALKTLNTRLSLVLTAVTLGLISTVPVTAQDPAGTPALGKVQFKVDCNEIAQREFNLAMAYYHSFAWSYVKDPLERVLKADRACGMAHWARVLGMLIEASLRWSPASLQSRVPEYPPSRERRKGVIDASSTFVTSVSDLRI